MVTTKQSKEAGVSKEQDEKKRKNVRRNLEQEKTTERVLLQTSYSGRAGEVAPFPSA